MNLLIPRHLGYAITAVVVLVGIGFLLGRQTATAPPEPLGAASNESSTVSVLPGEGTSTEPSADAGGSATPLTGTVTKPSATTIRFVTPAAGDVWAINENHPIIWNKESNITGGLYLVNEATGATVGWLVPTTGAMQTSFAWETRDASVNRTGGTGVTIAPGTYSLRLVLDGGKGTVASPAFTIVPQGAPQVVTFVVRMKNTKLTPPSLTVVRGTKIVFINNETKAQKVTGNGLAPFTVPANGGTYTLETSSLPPGTFNYITDLYSYQSQGTIVVK